MKDTHDDNIDVDNFDKLPEDGIDFDDDNSDVKNNQNTTKTTDSNANDNISDDKQKPGTNFFKQHTGSKPKLIIFLVIGIIIILLVCGLAYRHMNNKQQAPAGTPARQSLTSSNNGANTKFKNEVKPITTAQQDIQDVNNSWRDATVDFAKKRNVKEFKKELMEINDKRIAIYNRIKDNNNALVKPILATSDAIHSGLVDSYALTKNSDYQKAIKIYNDTNKQVTDNNRQYKDVLVDQLTKRHIQYTTNKTEDGWTVDY